MSPIRLMPELSDFGRYVRIPCHGGALIFAAGFSFGGSWILHPITDMTIPLRVSAKQEEIGLDLSRHGEVRQDTVVPPAPVLVRIA